MRLPDNAMHQVMEIIALHGIRQANVQGKAIFVEVGGKISHRVTNGEEIVEVGDESEVDTKTFSKQVIGVGRDRYHIYTESQDRPRIIIPGADR